MRIAARLTVAHDAAGLAVFRALYGVLVTVSAARFFVYGWLDDFFLAPRFFFHYWGTESWLPARPDPSMITWGMALLGVLGVLVTVGLFTRLSLLALALLFAWIQALDVTNYLNHYVLMSLLGLLMACMPLARAYSLDAWRMTGEGSFARRFVGLGYVPAWCTYLLRLQVGVVYFFAGLAKLTSDWLLHAQPLNIWLMSRATWPLFGPLFAQRATAYAFSWAGFLFDSTIVLWLSWRRTRGAAYLVVIGFHAMTGWLFPIGMFWLIMTSVATVFFEPAWPRRILARVGRPLPEVPRPVFAPLGNPGLVLVAVYSAWQLLMPLRTHLYGGNVLWHEQGMRFSWRVMVREKNAAVSYLVHEPATGRRWLVQPRDYLDPRQEREFATQPDLIAQLARRIAADERRRGHEVEVRVDAIASLNGRAPQRLIDVDVDLARQPDDLAGKPWILPAPTQPPPHLERR